MKPTTLKLPNLGETLNGKRTAGHVSTGLMFKTNVKPNKGRPMYR